MRHHDVERPHRRALYTLLIVTQLGLGIETVLRLNGWLGEPWTGVVFGGFVALGIAGSLLLGFTWVTPWTEAAQADARPTQLATTEQRTVARDDDPARERQPVAA